MRRSGRLKAIADAASPCRYAADIGTDHGYIPVYLVQKGLMEGGIAADISRGSLDKAAALIRENGLENVLEVRLGSGLTVLKPGEVDTIIIAGMGGLLIKDILEDSPEVARSANILVLQPMVAQEGLRRWLVENGYRITDEDLVKEDKRIYEIITAVSGREAPLKDIYYDIGYKLVEKQHPLLEEFVLQKMRSLEGILAGLSHHGTAAAAKRENELRKKLRQYKEVYRWDIRSKTL